MLYDIGFFIFSVIYLPVLIFKGKLHREFPERFGMYAQDKERALLSGRDRIWIQAVSVGEVALCRSFIPLLKERFPGRDLVISTITKTGNDLAKKLFSKEATIIFFPLDFGFSVRRAVKMIKPGIFIMVETEIWPNFLRELSLNSIPSVMINGRISDRSIGKYRLVKSFLKNTLSGIRAFCMQDTLDAERVISLGAPRERVIVTGNMKFDAVVPANLRGSDVIRRSLGLKDDDLLLVAGSTHSGEEELIVEAFKELIVGCPKLKLLIAPRHTDRTGEIESVIEKYGFEPVKVSKLNERLSTGGDRRILILDTIGHLNEAYAVATFVFIGGSLIRHGGQNPLEPAVLGKAILFGTHMFNFRHITKVLLDDDAALQVSGKKDLVDKLNILINDPVKRSGLGENAKMAITKNRGATKKNLEKISEILK
ncbi:MAG: glycosyltransferase N-terminal domain-containing protein [Candidatus Omnitrophota bacterium]|nr:glycosyltransferase N-terminal domain-containing protein [Candidatus Omnitrophota bacterium]